MASSRVVFPLRMGKIAVIYRQLLKLFFGFDVAVVVGVAGYLADTVGNSDADGKPSQLIVGVHALGATNVKEQYDDLGYGVPKQV